MVSHNKVTIETDLFPPQYFITHISYQYIHRCGHCQAMAADWETLATEWVGNEQGLIGEVDCDNDDNEPLCSAAGVQGFPTLKWGDPDELQEYNGGRDLSSMSSFAKENLKPMCSLKNIDLCSDEKKAAIEKYKSMSDDKLKEIIDTVNKAKEDSEEQMEEEIQKLQEKYDQLTKDHDARMKEVKDNLDFGLVGSVLRSRGINFDINAEDDDDIDDDDDDDDDDDVVDEEGGSDEL